MKILQIVVLASITALAACSGGGGNAGGGSSLPPVGPTQPPVRTATASGTLVNDSGAPVAGQPVSIAAWTPANAPYVVVATTAADGSFAFSTQPGQYLLRIGNDTPGAPMATVHDNITLLAGTHPLVAPTMPPEPNVTNPAIQTSGKFRMSTLTAVETECMTAANAHRASMGLPQFIADEWLLEDSRNYHAGMIANNQTVTSAKGLSGRNGGVDSGNGPGGVTNCTIWQGQMFTPGSVNYAAATDAQSVWTAAEITLDSNPGINQWLGNVEWMHDPRTETSSDPLYFGWP